MARWSPLRRQARPGFTIVELLVALAMASCILSAAWTWMWGTRTVLGRRLAACEAVTSLSFVRRSLCADVAHALAVVSTADTPSASTTLTLSCMTDGSEDVQIVRYVWDASRRVLWRKAPGCHVADDVRSFEVSYADSKGDLVEEGQAGRLTAESAATVSRISVRVVVSVGERAYERDWQTCLRAAW